MTPTSWSTDRLGTDTTRWTNRAIQRADVYLLWWDTDDDIILFGDTSADPILVDDWNATERTARTAI